MKGIEDRSRSPVELRSVTAEDRELLLRIYEASRALELSMMGTDEDVKRAFVEHQFDAQTRHYETHYPHASHSIIVYECNDVGRLYLNRGNAQIAILDLAILPEYRRRYIASSLIKPLLDEAAASARSVRIYLEIHNPAQRLFLDLGFEIAANEDGNLRYEWRP